MGVNRQEISNFPPIYFDIALLPVFLHDFTHHPGPESRSQSHQTEPESQHPGPVCPASVATLADAADIFVSIFLFAKKENNDYN